jgi:hypothetical protein
MLDCVKEMESEKSIIRSIAGVGRDGSECGADE